MNNFYPISKPSITSKEIDYVTDSIKSGWVSSLGFYVEEFEKQFAKFCETKYAVLTNNGTTGLHLALYGLGIKEGDEVIIPDLTFVATANAVAYIGAKPVMVDIDSITLCIDPNKIEKAVTTKTKAIIAVHLYGHPADLDEINRIAEKYKLLVLEDAAEAHGAIYKGKKVGSLSKCGVFSFYGNKIITTGEGGAITTNDQQLYERLKFLRDHAMSKEKRYWHTEVGFNYRMTNMQAALGLAQLSRIDEILEHRKLLFNWYSKYLNLSNKIHLNQKNEYAEPVYWIICLELENFSECGRDLFIENLKLIGVETRPYFFPVSAMPIYEEVENIISIHKSKIGLNIPTYFDLKEQDVATISKLINSELEKEMYYI